MTPPADPPPPPAPPGPPPRDGPPDDGPPPACLDPDGLRALLRRHADDAGGVRKLAGAIGVSREHLYNVLNGHRRPGGKVLGWLGVTAERRVEFVYRVAGRAAGPASQHSGNEYS